LPKLIKTLRRELRYNVVTYGYVEYEIFEKWKTPYVCSKINGTWKKIGEKVMTGGLRSLPEEQRIIRISDSYPARENLLFIEWYYCDERYYSTFTSSENQYSPEDLRCLNPAGNAYEDLLISYRKLWDRPLTEKFRILKAAPDRQSALVENIAIREDMWLDHQLVVDQDSIGAAWWEQYYTNPLYVPDSMIKEKDD